MCDIADRLRERVGIRPDRLVEGCADWATIVDIAPVVLGHLLVLPFEHVVRASQLGLDLFAKYWEFVGRSASTLTRLMDAPVVAIEHGSPSDRASMSCVRHCHTHLAPVDTRLLDLGELLASVDQYVEIEAVHSSSRAAQESLSTMAEYVLVRLGDRAVVGRPRPAIRQISRVLLASLNHGTEIRDVDWILETENPNYFHTRALFESSWSADVG